jgi:membrane protease YdiL (CAAX protease family)
MQAFSNLSPAVHYFLFIVLVFIPAMGVVGYFRLRSGKPLRPKRQRYISIIVVQSFLLLLTLKAAQDEGIELLGRSWGNSVTWSCLITFLVLVALRLPRAWRKLPPERLEKARRLLPDDPSLMRLWTGIAAMAGISEECAYRGLLFRLLLQMGWSIEMALVICAATFAIGHMTQGWRGVVGTAVLAIIFHSIVIFGNSLYPAILLHAVYNLMVGIVAMPVLSKFAKEQELTQTAQA